MNGSTPDCNGVCRRGKDIFCVFYYVDPIWKIFSEWKKEAKVETPILWKFDRKRNKTCLYTTKPGYFIGLHGKLYEKYMEKLRETKNEKFQNDIDIIECEDSI